MDKKPFIITTLRRFVRIAAIRLVDTVARIKKFSFPPKYTWRWKWEMLTETYESETTDFFRRTIQPGMVIVDVGAHIGYFTRLFSRLVGPQGRVHAFEPDPENYSLLQKNIAGLTNVTAHNQALGESAGQTDFYRNMGKTGSHSLIAAPDRLEKIAVNLTTLDQLRESGQISNIDFIKLDIEGGELRALQGMVKTFQALKKIQVVMEFCPPNIEHTGSTPEQFLEQTKKYGFEIYIIAREGLIPLDIDTIPTQQILEKKYQYVNILMRLNSDA